MLPDRGDEGGSCRGAGGALVDGDGSAGSNCPASGEAACGVN